MKDPMTVAHELNRPWPLIKKARGSKADLNFQWTVRIWPFAKHTYISPFVYIRGYELYFPGLITIWHTDPLGDAGPACHGRRFWKWHLHHMSVQFHPWQKFKQKHLTRCMFCGDKSSKHKGLVNFRDGWESPRVYHPDCLKLKSKLYHQHDPRDCWQCKEREG